LTASSGHLSVGGDVFSMPLDLAQDLKRATDDYRGWYFDELSRLDRKGRDFLQIHEIFNQAAAVSEAATIEDRRVGYPAGVVEAVDSAHLNLHLILDDEH
jgi:hypothetical protein